MIKRNILFFCFVCIFIISDCTNNSKNPDISNIRVNLKFLRFEQDLFKTDFEKIADSIPFFQKKYGEFFEIFNYKIIKIGSSRDPGYPDTLKKFLTDYTNNQIYKEVNRIFPNNDTLKHRLEDVFRYYKYYFPNMPVPTVITYISCFNQAVISTDTIIAIGLDDYLGSNCDFYKQMGLYQYKRYNMYKERIPVDCARLWALTQFPLNDSTNNLLANIIYQGKVLYFVSKLLPNETDTLITGISKTHLKWCKDFEEKMWTYLVENKLLFRTDYLTINKFINDGPFTKDFGKSSPARAAVWLGFQIINEYMNKNPGISLKTLMLENDYTKILRLSKFKP